MPDPCNSCGACCYRVHGTWLDLWKKRGWLRDDGRCVWYNQREKTCAIYAERPRECRMVDTKPADMTLEEWYECERVWCDWNHASVFGCPREGADMPCDHQHPWLEIQIETVTSCQAQCFMCPYSRSVNDGRRGKVMDDDLFRKIIDEVMGIEPIKQVSLQGLGEPLLDPKIVERVEYVTHAPRQVRTLMHTNGILLSPDMSKRLHDAGLAMLVVSMNATSAEQWERVFGIKGKYDQVCENLRAAKALPGWTVSARAVVNGDVFTTDDATKLKEQWGEDSILVSETNWISHNRTMHTQADPNLGCSRALTQIYVNYDGDVGMCCMDSFIRKRFGNLRTQTVREVYNSEEYVKFRKAHAEDRATDVPECIGCTRC